MDIFVIEIVAVLLIGLILVFRYRKKKKRAKMQQALLQQEQQAREQQIQRWRKELQENLLQYVNEYSLQINDEEVGFSDSTDRFVESDIGVVGDFAGLSICFGYKEKSDVLFWEIHIGAVICCNRRTNLHDAQETYNLYLETDPILKEQINPFRVGDNGDLLYTHKEFPFSQIMFCEKEKWEQSGKKESISLLKIVIERELHIIDNLFRNSDFHNAFYPICFLTRYAANISVYMLNQKTTANTAFDFKLRMAGPCMEIVGTPKAENDWTGECLWGINVVTGESGVIIKICFHKQKTKEELEQIAEEYNLNFDLRIFYGFHVLEAMVSDKGLALCLFAGNCDLKSYEGFPLLYQQFLQQSESIRAFFKEKD